MSTEKLLKDAYWKPPIRDREIRFKFSCSSAGKSNRNIEISDASKTSRIRYGKKRISSEDVQTKNQITF